jgi:two-component system, NarL family, response regulator
MPIRVLTVDDHPVVRAGVRAILANEADIEVVGEAVDGVDAVTLYERERPDVVLMDLRLPRMDGVAAIRRIIGIDPNARILALTSYDGDADIYRALDAGASGYLLKDMVGVEVIGAIRSLLDGKRVIPPDVATRLAEFTPRRDLTQREREVLVLAARGLGNKEIGRTIGRTEATAKAHLKNAMEKLGAQDRTAAVTQAVRRGIIRLD